MTEVLGKRLLDRYERLCREPSDIKDHLPKLQELAFRCSHVTEFGTRYGVSTTALLAGFPDKLVTYDWERREESIRLLEELAKDGGIEFIYRCEDVLQTPPIEETDFLFIDSIHNEAQVTAELRRHAHRVRRYLAFHDTTVAPVSYDNDAKGLWRGINAFLERNGAWKLVYHNPVCNGLAVLRKRQPEDGELEHDIDA